MRIGVLALVAGALAAGGMATPAAAARSASAAFLKLGVGARAAGMGEAYTALAHDASGLYWNTAGLARAERKQFIFMHNDWFENINYEYLGYVHPLADGGALGGSFTYIDKGDLNRTTYSNPFGAGMGNFSASDFAWGLAYARPYGDNMDLGVTAKLIYQKLDDATATSFAVDLGMQYRQLYPGLTLGLTMQNLGTAAAFDSKKEQLPLLLKAGAAYRLERVPLTIASDLVLLRGDQTSFRFGIEYELLKYLDLRAGYNSANDAGNGFGGGFGINIDDLEINYAYVPYGDLGNTHRIDSVFAFGAPARTPVSSAPPVQLPQPAPRPAPAVAPAPTPRPEPLPPSQNQTAAQYIVLGNGLAAAGDYRGAAVQYAEALKYDPRCAVAYYNIGNMAYMLRDYAAARDAFNYALQLKPNSFAAKCNLGSALYKLGDFAGAARCWEQTLQLDPANNAARNNLDKLRRRHPEILPQS